MAVSRKWTQAWAWAQAWKWILVLERKTPLSPVNLWNGLFFKPVGQISLINFTQWGLPALSPCAWENRKHEGDGMFWPKQSEETKYMRGLAVQLENHQVMKYFTIRSLLLLITFDLPAFNSVIRLSYTYSTYSITTVKLRGNISSRHLCAKETISSLTFYIYWCIKQLLFCLADLYFRS